MRYSYKRDQGRDRSDHKTERYFGKSALGSNVDFKFFYHSFCYHTGEDSRTSDSDQRGAGDY